MKYRFFALFLVVMVFFVSSCNKDTQLDDDKDAIKKYLNENNIVTKCEKNVFYEVITEGDGDQCNAGDLVACKYRLSTIGYPDEIIDEQIVKAYRVQLPATVPGAADVITGFQIALTTMREGGKSRFYIPSTLAYGNNAFGSHGETNANLIFEIELCEIISNGKKH